VSHRCEVRTATTECTEPAVIAWGRLPPIWVCQVHLEARLRRFRAAIDEAGEALL